MPITKVITLSSGIDVEYHRITNIVVNYLRSTIDWKVGSYINNTTFTEGKEPVHITNLSMQAIANDLNQELRGYLYTEMVNQVGGIFEGGTLD